MSSAAARGSPATTQSEDPDTGREAGRALLIHCNNVRPDPTNL